MVVDIAAMLFLSLIIICFSGVMLDSTGWISPIQIFWDCVKHLAPLLAMFGLPARRKLK